MRDESQNLLGLCERSLGHQAGEHQGVVADSSGAVHGHQVQWDAAGASQCSPLLMLAGGWGSWGERSGSITNLLSPQPVLEPVLECDRAAAQPGPGRCLPLALGLGYSQGRGDEGDSRDQLSFIHALELCFIAVL